MRRFVLSALLTLLVPLAPGAEGGAVPDAAQRAPRALLDEVDALYGKRNDPAALKGLRASLAEAEKAHPGDYEILWRLARLHFWLADDPALPGAEKSRLGRLAWDYGDRAAALEPARVEGWNYAAAGVGNYALGIGVLSALRQGIEGKFKERLSRAEAIDPGFAHGAIHTAWGRFWYELPWPKYSAERSLKALEGALARNPDNVRAHVYLGDLFAKQGQPERALAELRRALSGIPGRYDAPEEIRWQEVAKQRISDLERARGRSSEGRGSVGRGGEGG